MSFASHGIAGINLRSVANRSSNLSQSSTQTFSPRQQRTRRIGSLESSLADMPVEDLQELYQSCQSELEARWQRAFGEEVDKERMIVTLNVGGAIFATTASQLLKHGDSLFSDIVSELEGQLAHRSREIFIDRSPRLFDTIMEYLRMGIDNTLLEDLRPIDLIRLKRESEFYRLKELTAEIDDRLRMLKIKAPGTDEEESSPLSPAAELNSNNINAKGLISSSGQTCPVNTSNDYDSAIGSILNETKDEQ